MRLRRLGTCRVDYISLALLVAASLHWNRCFRIDRSPAYSSWSAPRSRTQHAAPLHAKLARQGAAEAGVDLNLQKAAFTYKGGRVVRPWEQFTGRWSAISRRLEQLFGSSGGGRSFRAVDVGSNYGFFSLQTALQHPAAEVVGIEGSVGVGNGKVGVTSDGDVSEILQTPAVENYLSWSHRLGLKNCYLAPEVWDMLRVEELGAAGWPICDVCFELSVIHHIDRLSHAHYKQMGWSRSEGFVKLLATFLRLAPVHFVELPGQRDLRHVFKEHGPSPRGVLEAAAAESGLQWQLTGPLFTAKDASH
eukprot:TRINITY_DN39831_c0_g1_i1.p1 TRINITY_DN39831_c0_g1~~TRINITY_DN39831_c0_g1_i1.p1  ORF type:complete len:305 (-),score=52.40 TRINITY_DN39831_c0_g1_i1:59-973(-)